MAANWEVKPDSVEVLGLAGWGWLPGHPCFGIAIGTAVLVLYDLDRQEVGDVDSPRFDVVGFSSENTS